MPVRLARLSLVTLVALQFAPLGARAAEHADAALGSSFPPLWETSDTRGPSATRLATPSPAPFAAMSLPEDAAWEGFLTPGPMGSSFRFVDYHGKLVLGSSGLLAAGHLSCGGTVIWNGAGFEHMPLAGNIDEMTVWNDGIVLATYSFAPSFSEQIQRFNGTSWDTIGAPNERVLSMIAFDGKLVVGGQFTSVSGIPANGIAAFDGVAWSAFGSGFAGHQLRALGVHAGTLIAGVYGLGVRAWNAALGTWQPLGPGLEGFITGLASDGASLYATGSNLSTGSTALSGIARWDGASWSGLGNPPGKSGNAVAVWNGKVVADISGPVGKLSQWDGISLSGVPGDSLAFGSSGGVSKLGVWGTRLVVTGSFSNNGAMPVPYIAIDDGGQWSTVGIPWDAAMKGPGFGRIDALESWNGKLLVGGIFSLVADQDHYLASPRIAMWDGAHWSPLSSNRIAVQYLKLGQWNGDLIVAGYSVSVGGTSIQRVARWNGTTWSAMGSNAPDFVEAIQDYHGDLYLGHDSFSPVAPGLVRWNGTAWVGLGTGLPSDSEVLSLCVHGDSLVAAGHFPQAGGTVANNIAFWDGVAWHPVGDGLNDNVYAVASWNGKVVAGGHFTASGAQPLVGAATWDGSTWQQMGTNVVQANYFEVEDGELFASGKFRLPDASVVTTVAHWTGSDWHILGSGTNGGTIGIFDGYLYETGSGIVNGQLSHTLSRVPLAAVLEAPRPHPISGRVVLAVTPNPAARFARFSFTTPVAGRARLTIHDVNGREVGRLVDGLLPAGEHQESWSAGGAPGVYFAHLETHAGRSTSRFVLLGR